MNEPAQAGFFIYGGIRMKNRGAICTSERDENAGTSRGPASGWRSEAWLEEFCEAKLPEAESHSLRHLMPAS